MDIVESLPDGLLGFIRSAKKIVLVANNPAVSLSDFEGIDLVDGDVVVSFNKCVNWRILRDNLVNVFVYGFNVEDKFFFGLPPRKEVVDFLRLGGVSFTILMGVDGDVCPLPGVGCYFLNMPVPALEKYPRFSSGSGRRVVPSTGFRTMVLFDRLREICGFSYEIVALGFSDEAGKLWGGHAWDYERRWLAEAKISRVSIRNDIFWRFLLWVRKFF